MNSYLAKKVGSALLVALITLVIVNRADGQVPRGFGNNLGSVSGVAVYSNGYSGYWSGLFNTTTKVIGGKNVSFNTGAKWQCVELSSRYLFLINGRQVPAINANRWFSTYGRSLRAVANGSAELPPAGAVVVWVGGPSGLGHVCVVKTTPSASSTSVATSHQNVRCTSHDVARPVGVIVTRDRNGKITAVRVANDGPSYGSKSYTCVGWLVP